MVITHNLRRGLEEEMNTRDIKEVTLPGEAAQNDRMEFKPNVIK